MTTEGYTTGSGNVFKDLGLPNAEEHLVKAQLVFKIDRIIEDRGLKQIEAADLLGVRQPDVSKMLRGEFRSFPWSAFRASSWRSTRMWRLS
jgi:predicted XRE-type DNA-binding protein